RFSRDWSSDVCSSDLELTIVPADGESEVSPDTPITVTAANGTIEEVKVTQSPAPEEGAGDEAAAEAEEAEEGGPAEVDTVTGTRSEERRVGKEGRARW